MRERPLAGRGVLVGRARAQAGKLAAMLRRQGARVIEVPFIEIRPIRSNPRLDSRLRHLQRYDWLILTSVNGVEVLAERARRLGVRLRGIKMPRVAAIGPATRAAIEKLGVRVSLMPPEYVAESVVRTMRRRVRGKRVLLVRAKVARDVIPAGLRRAGARVDVVAAYRTVVPPGSGARLRAVLRDPRRRPDAICFTSSSTARSFSAMLGRERTWLRGVALASVGPVTSETLRELGLRPVVKAKRYDMQGLVAALCRYFQRRLSC
jgi:uroporphyrinogen-III synthase